MEIILIILIFAAFVFVALKLDEQKEKDKEEKTIQERRKQTEKACCRKRVREVTGRSLCQIRRVYN